MSDENIRKLDRAASIKAAREQHRRGVGLPKPLKPGQCVLEVVYEMTVISTRGQGIALEAIVLDPGNGPHKVGEMVYWELPIEGDVENPEMVNALNQIAARDNRIVGQAWAAMTREKTEYAELNQFLMPGRSVDAATARIVSTWQDHDERWRIVCRKVEGGKIEVLDGWTRLVVMKDRGRMDIPVTYV